MQNKDDSVPSTSTSEKPPSESDKQPDSEKPASNIGEQKPASDSAIPSPDTEKTTNAKPDSTHKPQVAQTEEQQAGHLPKDSDKTTSAMSQSSPPESVFKFLKPSGKRYTFKEKDEL